MDPEQPAPTPDVPGERFAPSEVPCQASALNNALWLLHHRANESAPVRPWIAELLQSIPDDLGDADELHRALLRTRRSLSPCRSSDLETSLQQVRRHSTLYTPRSCTCLRHAWEVYVGRLRRLLKPVSDLPWDMAWLVTLDGTVQADRHGPLTVATLGRVLGLWHDTSARMPSQLYRLDVLEVNVGTGFEEHPLVSVLWGHGPRRRTVTLQALSPQRSSLAVRFFSTRPPGSPSQAARVSRWTVDMVQVVTNLATGAEGPDRGAMICAVADVLEGEGFDLLPQRTRSVAVRLSSGWSGTPHELVRAALAVTGDPHPPALR